MIAQARTDRRLSLQLARHLLGDAAFLRTRTLNGALIVARRALEVLALGDGPLETTHLDRARLAPFVRRVVLAAASGAAMREDKAREVEQRMAERQQLLVQAADTLQLLWEGRHLTGEGDALALAVLSDLERAETAMVADWMEGRTVGEALSTTAIQPPEVSPESHDTAEARVPALAVAIV